MKPIYVVVADNVHARIFTVKTLSSPLEEIETLTHLEGRLHDREMTSDFPGKIKGNGKMGHAFEQRTDPKQNESDKFASQIANYLEDAHNTNKFNQLLLIADPSFLGLLRKNFSEPIRKLVVSWIRILLLTVLVIFARTLSLIYTVLWTRTNTNLTY